MRSLRIIVNDIELDYVREDLKVREENSSFFEDIKVAHNTQPIRIIENTAAVNALGALSIVAAGKKKYFPCIVVRGAIINNGVLTQNEKIPGFRKCDLKYGSEVNGIMDKKIASFFPDYNVLGEENVAYEEESITEHNAMEEWVDHARDLEKKIFPEVKWQLPRIRYKDKFGTDLKEDDSHYDYRDYINNRFLSILAQNGFFTTQDVNIVLNYNVVAPQVFVLSPLFYAFQSLGYTLQGSVVRSDFFKRLLLLSHNDNMSKVVKRVTGIPLLLSSVPFIQGSMTGIVSEHLPFPTYIKLLEHATTSVGNFKVVFRFDIQFVNNYYFGLQAIWQGQRVGNFVQSAPGVYEEQFTFTVEEGQVGQILTLGYHSFYREIPVESSIEIIKDLPGKDFFDMHPTIDFSRYIPEWTVAEYLNNFQKLFNWKVIIDDVEKSVSLNFNESDYLMEGEVVVIQKSLKISAIKNIESETYTLSYENNEDDFQFISHDTIKENREGDKFTKKLPTKFKYIPSAGGTADLSESVEDKDGVGLVIYDPSHHPFTSASYQGKNLKIPGEGGIFDTYWRRWILFRLNSVNVKLTGPFTHTELYRISKNQKVYIDNQLWLVKAIEYKENSTALFETELELESVTF